MIDFLTPSNITFSLGILAIIFSVYNSFKNPQIKTDQTTISLREDLNSLSEQVNEIQNKHLTSVEANIKELSKTIFDLSLTVTRLSTIIDERIPKANIVNVK